MGKRILVVDDEPDMLDLLGIILRTGTGWEVETTNVSSEVLGLVEQRPYDLIVTDLKMPGLDGIEMMQLVRARHDIPFVFITAHGTIESAVEAVRKGALDYITKPFRKEQILQTVRNALKEK
jgi:DNA-binding NtrC family response regulator